MIYIPHIFPYKINPIELQGGYNMIDDRILI